MTADNVFRGEVARRELTRFVKDCWSIVEPTDPFVSGYHVDAICDHLTHIHDFRRLLICCPPRHTKSLLVSVLYPAWYWATDPTCRFIYTSYSLQLAIRDSVKCRRLLESDLYRNYYGHKFSLTGDQNTKIRYDNDQGGFRLATSTEGSVTGEGGEICVLDDPHNVMEADSTANRDAVVRWFNTVWPSRLNSSATGCQIVAMQRCHSNDVAGWILKNDLANHWCKLILPLEAGRCKFVSTYFKDARADGDLLCPARMPPKEVEYLKSHVPRRSYESQYNQSPSPSEDQLLNPDNFRRYDLLPEGGFRIAAVDLAISERGDYTVMAVADVHRDGNIYLVHLHRERMPGTKIIPMMRTIHATYNPAMIVVEDVAFQRLIIQEARAIGLPVKGIRPEGDKAARSYLLQVRMESGQFHLPRGPKYVDDIIDECADFPNGAHDDICFVAGTMIETSSGRKPIESIRVGEWVRTRHGTFQVAASGCTGKHKVYRLTCDDGTELIGTGNHPILTDKGWRPLHSITNESIIIGWKQQSNTTDEHTADILTQSISPTEIIINAIQHPKEVLDTFTEIYGQMPMGRFRKDATFTTRTETHSTTHSITSNALLSKNIDKHIQKWGHTIRQQSEQTWTRFVRSLLHGIKAKREENGIAIMQRKDGLIENQLNTLVQYAIRSFKLITSVVSSSVLTTARRNIENDQGSITNNATAPYAVTSSPVTDTPKGKLVQKTVQRNSEAGVAKVYNLTVTGVHEYIANGIIVHNCDAISYLSIIANDIYRRIPEKKPEVSEEERRERARVDLERRMREDEENYRKRFFSGN